ncbi:hypothetical protein ACE6H2_019439 [Prunus campanulata]
MFHHPWLPLPSSFRPSSPPFFGDDATVQFLIDSAGCWNLDLLSAVFWKEEVAAILSIPLVPNSSDRLIWHYAVNGKYSVKSGYWLSQSLISRQQGDVSGSDISVDMLWSSIWALRVPNKLKVGTFKELYLYVISVLNNDELVFFVFLSWGLWSSRNDFLHSGRSTSHLCLLARTRKFVLEYQRAIILLPSRVPAINLIRHWSPPTGNFVKINVDGAVNLLFGFRGLGVVIRDNMGDLMMVAYKGLHGMFSPKATELYAAILGLQIARQLGHFSVILEMDAKEIIMNLQSFEESWSVEGVLVDEVKGLFNHFTHISCQFAPRECNQVAHLLAKQVLLTQDFKVWLEDGPLWISDVLASDKLFS